MKFKKTAMWFLFIIIGTVLAAETTMPIPKISMGVGQAETPQDLVASLQILLILTVLTLAPSIIIMTTSFIRVVIVLHFTRQALGLQQVPPNQVLIGLAIFLTFFIMRPTFDQVMTTGINPYLEKKITQKEMFQNVEIPMKIFMLKQTRTKDLELFLKLSKTAPPTNRKELPISVVLPAFVIGEINKRI
jgi:flagellar biosynthesis protein FliP